MVNYCVSCKTTSASSFHRFPKDKDIRSKWLQAINMDKVSQCARLCSNHFKPTDYQETNISKEQSNTIKIEECSMEYNNASKNNRNFLKRKSMEDDEIDIPLKHIRYIKDINVGEVSKNQEEAAIVIEIALETIAEQKKRIQKMQKQAYNLKKRIRSLTELNKHLQNNYLISNI